LGSTRYGNIDFANKNWRLAGPGSIPSCKELDSIKEAKFLLLSYGFDSLNLNRIELKTSSLNLMPQKAMLKWCFLARRNFPPASYQSKWHHT
jgi:RimJ/RimL family protein N-acetyltransferase